MTHIEIGCIRLDINSLSTKTAKKDMLAVTLLQIFKLKFIRDETD